MTAFRPRQRLRLPAFIASVFLALTGAAGHAADDTNVQGTFNTQQYPSSGNNPSGATSGDRSGQGNPRGGATSQDGPALQIGPNQRADSPYPRRRGYADDAQGRRPDAAPAKPGEFQKFVEGATGRLLPIFGTSFFSQPSDTFQPVDNVPVSADYTVGPGDEILLRAWGSIDVDYRSTVDRNGMLNLPKVGSFSVAGVKASELEKNLRAQIGRLFTNFNLSVSLGQLRATKVFVVGPAQRPGVYTLPSQSTMLSAVVSAGGPSPSGSMRKVLLRRDGRIISELDIYEFLVQGDKSKDVQLSAGDVVVFQPAGPRVALSGALDNPAVYELKSAQEPVREVLRYAGASPVLVNPNRAQLERVDAAQPKAARFVEEFKLDGNGLQKTLRDGDILTLLAISPQFANAVTLKGHVAQPLRYAYKPGMRIRDLIPDRDALISPDFYRRKNLLVQVLEPDDEDTDTGTSTGAGMTDNGSPGGGASALNAGTNGINIAGGTSNARPNGGSGTPQVSTPRRRAERLEREADYAAVNRAKKAPAALFDELNWDYAVIERLNERDLSTQVIPFNLGKAVLQGDEANNLSLLPGDVVTIYSQKDVKVPVARQTRLVSLEGEVGAPGVYQLMPGETLRGLLTRAGGFSPQAYVYGLEFSREETRQRQRENLTAAIARFETLAATQTARDAANRRDDPAAAATSSAVTAAATQAQLARLRAIQPNGRIALELSPDSSTIDALPDVPLDNGDRISVPPRPGFVTVAGAVVNGNAFIWKPGRTAGDYLKLAGADEAADTTNMFILRADGTVTHAGDQRGFFRSNTLEAQPMQPGDALIVPNQLDFETWGRSLVRNLKDFSQIFSGFGIGIAAIHSITN